jgi:predicted AlkP superfamily phosphohydrolase/phosphomutase
VSQLGERDALFVMSDHGFASFRRGVNLNVWLQQEGYLHLLEGAKGEEEWLREVDWRRTQAYAIGLGGLYLNVKGREAQGIVEPQEVASLKQEMIEKLTGLRDGEGGSVAIARAMDTAAVNKGPYADLGPDITVGYAVGYRASWGAAQGQVCGPAMEDNTRRWSGDHCLDPDLVPGILLADRSLPRDDASIVDLAPTILELFGVRAPGYMQGRSLLAARGEKETVAGE